MRPAPDLLALVRLDPVERHLVLLRPDRNSYAHSFAARIAISERLATSGLCIFAMVTISDKCHAFETRKLAPDMSLGFIDQQTAIELVFDIGSRQDKTVRAQ